MYIYDVTLSSQMVKRNICKKTILLLVYPDRATISIAPELPLQEVGRLAFTAQQHDGVPSCHCSGGRIGCPSCPSFPKGGLRQCTCLPILKTPPPSVVEASCFHSLTMCQLSVSVSKYCCLFILYVSSYIMIFLIRVYL